jgi:hypothetical protein
MLPANGDRRRILPRRVQLRDILYVPFAYPGVLVVLAGMASGILLSFATELLFEWAFPARPEPWSLRQWAGLLLLLASLCAALLAWMSQLLQEYLQPRLGPDRSMYKRLDHITSRRHFTLTLLLLALLTILLIVMGGVLGRSAQGCSHHG